jgi:Zn-dependent protease
MLPTRQGSFRLFRAAGIDVFLHWSWFVIALIEVQARRGDYSSLVWNALEYISLFLIVLMHEFGHALACRQVGGKANQIVLWPLGGVAYVAPPQRPGAMLWSIAAGPLVNVILFPLLLVGFLLVGSMGLEGTDVYRWVRAVFAMNLGLLIFNLLPIYPLDGGQILRSLLWFMLGRAQSLFVTTIIGFVAVGCVVLVAAAGYFMGFGGPGIWFVIVMGFISLNCLRGLMQARVLAKAAKLPRREGFACPVCRQPPVIGRFWVCHKCGARFDTFQTQGACPVCATQFATTTCVDCGESRPIGEWIAGVPTPPVMK